MTEEKLESYLAVILVIIIYVIIPVIIDYVNDRLNFFGVASFLICYVIIPLILAYRSGYLLNLRARFKDLRDCISPPYAPSEWSVTSVRRLSLLEKVQIKSLTIQYRETHYWVVIQIKLGGETRYPLAEEIASNRELLSSYLWDSIDKNKVLIRRLEKAGNSSYSDIMPL